MMRRFRATLGQEAGTDECGTQVLDLCWLDTTHANREVKPMICQFCQQDVKVPCRNAQEMRQRAVHHVERCEKALRDAMGDGINPSDGQSAGSI